MGFEKILVVVEIFGMFAGPKKCAKCDKQVYPIEELKCLDKIWHKICFKCTVCNSLLNMKNYKGFDKQPYCVVHYPQQKPTVVSDNPELLRIKENTKIQSNVKYHEDFEKSKGTYTVVADDPETRRILENTKIISQVKYHEDFERNIKNKHIGADLNQSEGWRAASTNGSLQKGLVATFKSGGVINEKPISDNSIPPGSRKIGSIADYDPLGYETTVSNDRFGRSVYSTGNLQNGMGGRTAAFNSTSNIGSYSNSNGNGFSHHNGTNGVGSHHFNHNNIEYDIAAVQQEILPRHYQLQPQPQIYQNDIKTSVYKAIYDYDAKEDDEISFRDGDKFINCEQIDVGWMIGVHEKTGKHGMFPANYAEPVDFF